MIKLLLLLLPLVSLANSSDEAVDINTHKVYEVNKGILDNELELYDYENNSYQTYEIENKEDNIIKSIEPEKYKGICFDNQRHFNYNPKNKFRLILVATFI